MYIETTEKADKWLCCYAKELFYKVIQGIIGTTS